MSGNDPGWWQQWQEYVVGLVLMIVAGISHQWSNLRGRTLDNEKAINRVERRMVPREDLDKTVERLHDKIDDHQRETTARLDTVIRLMNK